MPLVWDLVDGTPTLFGLASWGGIPALMEGGDLARLRRTVESVEFIPHPGYGVWIESVLVDDDGAWYGFYHHEQPADICSRPDRSIPRIAAARSTDRGRTWHELGVVLEAPPDMQACGSSNRFVVGGVGDLSAMLDEEQQDLYIYFTQYSKQRSAQGVAVGRMPWATRDEPAGRLEVWNDGAWLPPRRIESDEDDALARWEYPLGTPLVAAQKPWHDNDSAADVYWGPSIHWNTYLERYVMLMNRTKDEAFNNEGIYIAYSTRLEDPRAWSTPVKLMNGGGWYPQVAGLEAGEGSDKRAGQRARFFTTGRSEWTIEFRR